MGVGFRAGMLMILYVLVLTPQADVRCWLDRLLLLGPSYGYFPEPCKSYLMVAPHKVSLPSDVFAGLGISFISEPEYCEELISHRVNGWVHSINALAEAASLQAVFAAMVKSLQFDWSHVQRVVSNCGPVFQ